MGLSKSYAQANYGRSIRLWIDPWFKSQILLLQVKIIYFEKPSNKWVTLDYFIRDGVWVLPIPHSVKLRDIYKEIPKIPIYQTLDSDADEWHPSKSGKFSTRSASEVISNTSKVRWASLIWFKGRIMWHSFIGSLLCLNRLPALDRLSKWGCLQEINIIYVVTLLRRWTTYFLECVESNRIWEVIMSYCNIPPHSKTWSTIIPVLCISWSGENPTNTAKRLLVIGSIYHIWMENNRRAFTSQTKHAREILLDILTEILIKLQSLKLIRADFPLCNLLRSGEHISGSAVSKYIDITVVCGPQVWMSYSFPQLVRGSSFKQGRIIFPNKY